MAINKPQVAYYLTFNTQLKYSSASKAALLVSKILKPDGKQPRYSVTCGLLIAIKSNELSLLKKLL